MNDDRFKAFDKAIRNFKIALAAFGIVMIFNIIVLIMRNRR